MGVCGCAVWDGPRRLGSWSGKAVEVDEPPEIVDEVGHADLQPGAGDSDGSDEEGHLVFLHREDMLDARADLGLEGLCHIAVRRARSVSASGIVRPLRL